MKSRSICPFLLDPFSRRQKILPKLAQLETSLKTHDPCQEKDQLRAWLIIIEELSKMMLLDTGAYIILLKEAIPRVPVQITVESDWASHAWDGEQHLQCSILNKETLAIDSTITTTVVLYLMTVDISKQINQ